jgi:hypothetical protein
MDINQNILAICSKIFHALLLLSFISGQIVPSFIAEASMSNLPRPGRMITITSAYVPPMLKGMRVDGNDPFKFEFILDSGNAQLESQELREEATTLIKYFLAALTIPENDLWVNLSPYEKNKIIPSEFGLTEMGRDLLVQDYILKQLTASLIYPEGNLGKQFWSLVYERVGRQFGTTDVPMNTFNKVWVVPDKAVVYQNAGTAYVIKSHLKVMLEEDYFALSQQKGERVGAAEVDGAHSSSEVPRAGAVNNLGSQIVREIILPVLEKEVNEGKNFAQLRQIYQSLILAKWYKENLRQSVLNQKYSDQKKTAGVEVKDRAIKEKIYQQYLEAFKQGVFNYIKEDYDATSQTVIPRKYFSGGLQLKVPLEIETNPNVLANSTVEGKLSWIMGVYRQPRVSARFVNEYIASQFQEGKVGNGMPILLNNGKPAKVYLIEGLLRATGQFGHIGLGVKARTEAGIVYEENGIPVVYIDSDYADNPTVRANEQYKVEQWERQMEKVRKERGLSEKLTAEQMRQWIKDNMIKAAKLLRQWDQEAPSLTNLFKLAKERNVLPSVDNIVGTYINPDDFGDLNLAAGNNLFQFNGNSLEHWAVTLKKNLGVVKFEQIILMLREGLPEDEREFFLNNIILPVMFLDPKGLTYPILEEIKSVFEKDKSFQTFLILALQEDRISAEVKRKAGEILFSTEQGKALKELQEMVKEKFKNGNVLVVNNINEGLGDELIRNHILIQSMLDFNDDLSVVIVTKRPFLYNHPRVTVVNQDNKEEVDVALGKSYDMVVNHFDEERNYSSLLESKVRFQYEKKDDQFLYVKTNKLGDNFLVDEIRYFGKDIKNLLFLDNHQVASVYYPSFKLVAGLGIPLSTGEKMNNHKSVIVGNLYPEAIKLWIDLMKSIGNFNIDKNS